MDLKVLLYSIQALIQNTIFAVVSIFVLLISFMILDKYVIKNIDTLDELRKNNVSVAIVAGASIIAAALIIALK